MSSARLLMEKLNSFRNSSGGSVHQVPVDPDTSRVKRALFGPVDHEENRRFVKAELERTQRLASERWNFDFGADTPLPGRFQWETVRVPLLRSTKTANSSSSDKSENKSSTNNSSSSSTNAEMDANSNARPTLSHNGTSSKSSRTSSSDGEEEKDENCLESASSSSSFKFTPNLKSSSSSNKDSELEEKVCDNNHHTSSSQRTSRASRHHQTHMKDFYTTRKRSKSKVKVQERKINDRKTVRDLSASSSGGATLVDDTSSSSIVQQKDRV